MLWYAGYKYEPTRRDFYNVRTTPSTVFVGTNSVDAPGSGNVTAFVELYNQLKNTAVPLDLDLTVELNDNGKIVVESKVKLTEALTGNNYNIFHVLTYDNGLPVDHNNSTGFPLSRFRVIDNDNQNFPLRAVNEEGVYTSEFWYNPDWEIGYIRAVSFIQLLDGSPTVNKPILQAKMVKFEGNITAFAADITSGPPNLTVTFSDRSVTTDAITSYSWDFGDGSAVSNEESPTHTYTKTGVYDVSLKITTDSGESTRKFNEFIVAYNSDNVRGNVAGIWTQNHSPYIVKDDVNVPVNLGLVIESGVRIISESGKTITVAGAFEVRGVKENPVIFTANDTWRGLMLTTYPDTTFIRYAFFEKASGTAIQTFGRAVSIENCGFTTNNNPAGANAINIENCPPSQILESFFSNNKHVPANNSIVSSTTVGIVNTVALIRNCVLVNNQAHAAPAIRVSNRGIATIENCTIFNNQQMITNNNFGSVFVTSTGSEMHIINSIIDKAFNSNATMTINYSNVLLGLPTNPGTNISLDPKFVNPSTGIGPGFTSVLTDWYISPDSPCIDAGHPDSRYNDMADLLDPMKALFPAHGSIRNDMGAFGGGGSGFSLNGSDNTITLPHDALSIQTYPNPFNPTLNINLDIKNTDQRLNVSIYNIKGQKVIELYNDTTKSGNMNLSWNGKDDSGKSLSSGIYFVRANNLSEQTIKKVVLLK